MAERYRGAPRLNINPDNGETLCIACNLCALACPETLIVVGSERNEQHCREASPSQAAPGSLCWTETVNTGVRHGGLLATFAAANVLT